MPAATDTVRTRRATLIPEFVLRFLVPCLMLLLIIGSIAKAPTGMPTWRESLGWNEVIGSMIVPLVFVGMILPLIAPRPGLLVAAAASWLMLLDPDDSMRLPWLVGAVALSTLALVDAVLQAQLQSALARRLTPPDSSDAEFLRDRVPSVRRGSLRSTALLAAGGMVLLGAFLIQYWTALGRPLSDVARDEYFDPALTLGGGTIALVIALVLWVRLRTAHSPLDGGVLHATAYWGPFERSLFVPIDADRHAVLRLNDEIIDPIVHEIEPYDGDWDENGDDDSEEDWNDEWEDNNWDVGEELDDWFPERMTTAEVQAKLEGDALEPRLGWSAPSHVERVRVYGLGSGLNRLIVRVERSSHALPASAHSGVHWEDVFERVPPKAMWVVILLWPMLWLGLDLSSHEMLRWNLSAVLPILTWFVFASQEEDWRLVEGGLLTGWGFVSQQFIPADDVRGTFEFRGETGVHTATDPGLFLLPAYVADWRAVQEHVAANRGRRGPLLQIRGHVLARPVFATLCAVVVACGSLALGFS